MIALADLSTMTEQEVIKHLASEYSEIDSETQQVVQSLSNMEVLIAYESVGDYGCDSASFFLLKDKPTGKLYEIHGSHCSCYGFEGQIDLMKETTVEALAYRLESGGRVFSAGGYDDNETDNERIVNVFVKEILLG